MARTVAGDHGRLAGDDERDSRASVSTVSNGRTLGGPSSAGRSSISGAGHQMVDAVGVVQSPGQIWNFLSVRDESISLARDGQDIVGLIRDADRAPFEETRPGERDCFPGRPCRARRDPAARPS